MKMKIALVPLLLVIAVSAWAQTGGQARPRGQETRLFRGILDD